jgi:hypothetical protein
MSFTETEKELLRVLKHAVADMIKNPKPDRPEGYPALKWQMVIPEVRALLSDPQHRDRELAIRLRRDPKRFTVILKREQQPYAVIAQIEAVLKGSTPHTNDVAEGFMGNITTLADEAIVPPKDRDYNLAVNFHAYSDGRRVPDTGTVKLKRGAFGADLFHHWSEL